MSTYSTWDQIRTRVPETVEMDDEKNVLDQQQSANYQLINAKLANRYSMPADVTLSPQFFALLGFIEADLTAADICDFARETAADSDTVRWYAEELRNNAMRYLDGLADGTMLADDGIAVDGTVVGPNLPDDGLTAADVEDGEPAAPWFTRAQVGPKAF